MKKLTCVVSCPISTYSGYGARSRDFVRALIENYPDWDVKILEQRWGNTRRSYLQDFDDKFFSPLVVDSVNYKPDVWIQITIPNEFKKIGALNIGVTAGIETTICHHTWLQGINNMDVVLASSNHTKEVFDSVSYEVKIGTNDSTIKALKPVEVLFEGVDTDVYKVLDSKSKTLDLSDISESFCFLTVGHWMQGDLGHDRKNIGYTIKAFLETFKNKNTQPALILKTLQATSSILDRDEVLKKINAIRKTVKGDLPNIYLLHGDMSDEEMNLLYNHPKVKCLVSLTKGEGYGRPLAEFASIGKPVIASNWSGQKDFLSKENCLLIGGTLENVHPSAHVKDMLMKESKWFKPDDSEVGHAFRQMFKEYKLFLPKANEHGKYVTENFSYDSMKTKLKSLLDPYVEKIPRQVELQLPNLKKIQ